MTGYATIENAVLSMKHGAVDYLTKPLRAEALRLAVNNAIELERLRRENESFREEIDSLRGSGERGQEARLRICCHISSWRRRQRARREAGRSG